MATRSIRTAGYTLIEMLAALAVMALVALFAVPLTQRAYDRMELRTSARDLAAAMTETRARAVGAGRPVVLSIDLNRNSFQVGADPAAVLSEDMALTVTSAAEISDSGDGVARFAFFPDGSGTGGRVRLDRDGSGYEIAIDWLTGSIETKRHVD